MSLLRSARRQQPPVVVVHPRHPELCLAAPSHASSGSDHNGGSINDHHPHPPQPLEPNHSNNTNNPSTPSRITIREELVFLRQGRPLAAHALPAAASPLPPPLSVPRPNGGRGQRHPSQPPPPPLLLRSCAPGGRPATSCFCNVTTLYD